MLAALAVWEFIKRFWPLFMLIALIGMAWGYGQHKYSQGYAAAETKYVAQLELCKAATATAVKANADLLAALETSKRLYDESQRAVKEIEKRELAALERTNKVLAENMKRERALKSEIARLQALADAPAASAETACSEAEQILRDVAKRDGGAG